MAAASEPPMVEQVITEFFAKSLHIILESRSPYVSSRNFARPSPPSSPLSGTPPRDRWFNLALRDCPAALENFDLWRQSNLEPLVIDIVLLRRDQANAAAAGGSKVVERWVIQYETHKASNGNGNGNGNGSKNSSRKPRGSLAEEHGLYRRTYKGSTVLLRSLYLVVRLLPAYNLFRELNSSGRICPLSLSHKISSYVEPFTRAEDAEMSHFAFAPIETPKGSLSLSVSYLPVLDVAVDSEPTTPVSPELITDYVGSPTTHFLKSFQSLPSAGIAPACIVMTRRHSWSMEHGAGPLASPSPSPTYSETHVLHSNQSSRPPQCSLMHDNSLTTFSHPHNTLLSGQKKNATFDECYPSPPLSPSLSHSPSGSHQASPLFHRESAPVNIPAVRTGGCSGLPPSPRLKGKQQCSSQINSPNAQVSANSPNNKSNVKKDLVRLGEFESEKVLQKVLSFGKDDLGYFHGLKLSRTSSKLFIMDELDDMELVFAGDDRDIIIDQINRANISESEDLEGSQEAEVSVALTRSPAADIGALVRMLKTAPGLRESLLSITAPQVPQEPSIQRVMSEEPDKATSSSAPVHSGLMRSQTASDALEELKKYKEMKESILSRGGLKSQDANPGDSLADKDP